MPGLQVHFEVLNQLNTPTLYADTLANRPTAQIVGRIFFRTDTPFGVYRDTGSGWDLVANLDTNSGGTVTNVSALTLGTTGTDLSSTVANGTTTPVITLNVPTASSLNRGALSSLDWSTFNGKFTLPSLTSGSILFSDGTTIAQKNANFFWDNTNNRLGIGNTIPGVTLDIHGAGVIVHINGTSTNNAFQTFQNAGTGKWRLGNNYSTGTNYFSIFDVANSIESLKLTQSTTILNSILSGPTYFKPSVTETGIAAATIIDFNSVLSTNTYNAGITRTGLNDLGLYIQQTNTYSGAITFANTGNRAVSYINGAFTLSGTVTQNQPAYILAYSCNVARWAPAGTGTFQYLSNYNVGPDFGGTSVTVTNRYGILINNFAGFGTNPTYTNRWAIYQEGTSDNNYFGGKIVIGTTTVSSYALSINGTTLHSGQTDFADAVNITTGTTTGTKIGTATTQKIGFWNVAPIVQPTTAVASATFVVNAGTAINTLSTFDGYKIDQIVKALRNLGILA